ncbi:MAG: ribosome small subunit-dependent GTPase A [Oscillospiraceae bacterium]|jgi:ribosome biogenesis GTPase|nr:ribosome small subunit-dependent GTPase A [Oscillospiraceae bacterium]
MIDLTLYGCHKNEPPPEGLISGRVTELQREQYTAVTEFGEVTAELKGTFLRDAVTRDDLPCVGDFVLLQYNTSGPSLIVTLLPRHSKFSRFDRSGHGYAHIKANREQIVAVNFDVVFILSSLNRDFNLKRIARYLTQAWQSGGQPVVVLTKADLAENNDSRLDAVREIAPGVPVHAVSAYTRFGLETLDEYLQPGKTVVFLGMSGVGKSSLLNALMGRDVMTVKGIREDDSRGRHTTTHRQLFMLPSGAMVIDTPGMRELGLFGADEGISAGFSDVEELFARCRFADCRHQTEPGCAVLAALEDGTLRRKRWEQYLAQRKENKYADDRTGYLTDKRTRNKSIALWSKEMKKNGGIRK